MASNSAKGDVDVVECEDIAEGVHTGRCVSMANALGDGN